MTQPAMRSMTSVDGRITPTEQACIPVLDRGFLYGDSVYEVFRTYSGVPLFFDEHWRRLENSAQLAHMKISQDRDWMLAEIRRTVRATGSREAGRDVYVRYIITRGEGPVDLYARPDLVTRYVVIVRELPGWDPEFYRRGVRVAIPKVRRNPIDALDPNIKGGNYLNNVLAVTEARGLGADDSVILNRENVVTEASNSNVFFVFDGVLVTPAPGAGNLAGLTKGAAMAACAQDGLVVIERDVHADELPAAEECFLTSATREVMPVLTLRLESGDLVRFPPGGGPLTRRVSALYKGYIEEHVRRHAAITLW